MAGAMNFICTRCEQPSADRMHPSAELCIEALRTRLETFETVSAIGRDEDVWVGTVTRMETKRYPAGNEFVSGAPTIRRTLSIEALGSDDRMKKLEHAIRLNSKIMIRPLKRPEGVPK